MVDTELDILRVVVSKGNKGYCLGGGGSNLHQIVKSLVDKKLIKRKYESVEDAGSEVEYEYYVPTVHLSESALDN